MSTLHDYEPGKAKEEDEVRERMPSSTLHYGSPNVHDPFMYRPFLPQPTPLPHVTQSDQNGSRPLVPSSTAAATAAAATAAGLRMSIYTCERCMHGFTHASDFLHHKAICMGTICSPEAEAKLRESVQAKMEKIMDKERTDETTRQESLNFQHIAKSITNQVKLQQGMRSQSPGSTMHSPKPGSGARYNCRYCDKQFDAVYIQNHELTHLIDSPDKPYSCEYCGRMFANLPACQNHERIHLEPRPYICDICNKGFMTQGILKTHMLTHSGLKRFICATCDKAFSTQGNLKTHENIHKGEKPYACGQCGKCFTTAGNLKTHEKIHIGLKPFACQFCLKTFTTAGNLRTHVNIHSGNKPFECDQCHKSFTTAGNLKTHYRLHTGERPYVCNICNQAYHSSANLRSHQKGVHGIDVEPRSPRIFSPPHSPRVLQHQKQSPHGQSLNSPGTSGSFNFPARSPPAGHVMPLPNATPFPFNKPAFPGQMSPSGSGNYSTNKSEAPDGINMTSSMSPGGLPSHGAYSQAKPSSSNTTSMASQSHSQSFPYSTPSSSANHYSMNNPYTIRPQQGSLSIPLNNKPHDDGSANNTPTNNSSQNPHNQNSAVQVLPSNPFPNYFPTPKQSPKPTNTNGSPQKLEQGPQQVSPNKNMEHPSPQNPGSFHAQSPPLMGQGDPGRNDNNMETDKPSNEVPAPTSRPLPHYPSYNQQPQQNFDHHNSQFFSL